MKRKKKGLLVILGILSFAGIWMGIWYVGVFSKYDVYVENIEKVPPGVYLFTDEDGYAYSVKKPAIFSQTGNLAIVSDTDMPTVIVWPLLNGDYEYGLQLQDENQQYFEVMVDEEFNFIPEKNQGLNEEMYIEIKEANKEELEKLHKKLNEFWQL